MSQRNTELSAPLPHPLETFGSLLSWSGFPGCWGGRSLPSQQSGSGRLAASLPRLPAKQGALLKRARTPHRKGEDWEKEGFGGEMNFLLAEYELILGCRVWGTSSPLETLGFPRSRFGIGTKPMRRSGLSPCECLEMGLKAAPRALPMGTQLLPHPSSLSSPLCIHKRAQAAVGRTERYHSPRFNFNYTGSAGALRAGPAGL